MFSIALVRWAAVAATLAIAVTVPAGCGGDESAREFGPPRLRRLRASQYVNAVRDLLGEPAALAATPPRDISVSGFDAIGATQLDLGDSGIEQYETSARAIAAVVVADPGGLATLMGCTPTAPDDTACWTSFVRTFVRRAWRRTPTEDEVTRMVDLAKRGAELESVPAGAADVISATLQAPHFVYLVEIGTPDPDRSWRVRLTGPELATRMSFFLVGTTPDDALLDAAEAGELESAASLRDHARQLLARPEARRALEDYYRERFRLREMANLSKDPVLFPTFTPELAAAMERESLLLFEHIVWDLDGDVRELLTADYAFVNGELAALYGTAPVTGEGFERRDLGAAQGRRGLLGQAAFLAVTSHSEITSPTRRGKHVRERLMCRTIPPPPPEVVPFLPPPIPDFPQTTRERLTEHRDNEICAGCHALTDEIGFAFESFDAMGAYRTEDNGLPIDDRGTAEDLGTFKGLGELVDLMVELPDYPRCWTQGLFRQAVGHVETADELELLDGVNGKFERSGFRVQELLLEIVASDPFRFAGVEPEPAP